MAKAKLIRSTTANCKRKKIKSTMSIQLHLSSQSLATWPVCGCERKIMPSPTAVKPGVIKDPAIAALFSNKDPEVRFDDLREIGHGSFGAVYYAFDKDASETVAIKKMSYAGKQAAEKWTDILKEVAFLKKVSHKNIVSYKACFLKDHTCWLIMEYCIGSAADIVDVLRKGLREVEIAVICAQTLSALTYLHSMKRIHRDIKAGNILLSDRAIVKLADFGSASMSDPAHTFIGTPFFMAPEVILAMDEGHYTDKADIWSLGITCIELAERKPPLFNMNTMSALYHIAQNDPPKLAPVPDDQTQWSEEFHSFVDQCLRKDPDDRISSEECQRHPFVSCPRPSDTIHELIIRTKNVVMELDNFQYKKMRKLMYLDEADLKDVDSGQGTFDNDGEENIPNSDVLSVDRGANDSTSSRSTSIRSLPSYRSGSVQSSNGPGNHRRPPIPSSMRQDSKEAQIDQNRILIPITDQLDSEKEGGSTRASSPSPAPPVRQERDYREDVQTLRKSKFSTLRSAKLISREQEEYSKENNMYEQMSGYKRLRQSHHKEMEQLEEKCAVDMEMLRCRLEKETEQLQSNNGKERQRIKLAHQNELERRKREGDDGEKKLRKQIMTRHQREMSVFSSQQLKEYKHNKEQAKNALKQRGLMRSVYEQMVKDAKANLTRSKQQAEAAFDAKLRAEFEQEILQYKRSQLRRIHQVEEKLEDEELGAMEKQMDAKHTMLLKHHEATKELEVSNQWELQSLKRKHQDIQHEAESNNQQEYNRRMTDDLRKKHALQSKQQPRELKIKEQQIRKQMRQAVKTQTRQYKLLQTQLIQAAPRDEQKDISNRLKDEQKRKLAVLASQYESQIENMVQEKTVKLESWQEDEARTLMEKLSKELDELKAYQLRQKQRLDESIAKERTALADRIALRYAVLTQRFEEERNELARLRESRRSALMDRHARESKALDDTDAEGSHTTSL